MATPNYKFSIIIATYNRSASLKECVSAALKQDYGNFEVIISDDASTDSTKETAGSFNDPRIIYIRNKKNSGLSAARNTGIKESTGDYFVVIDDDTLLKDDFLKKLGLAISGSGLEVFCPQFIDPQDNKPFIEFSGKRNARDLGYLDFNCFRGGCHIFSRKILETIGYYDKRFGVGSRYPAAEESDYFFRIKKVGKHIRYLPELVAYHPKETNPSSAKVYSYSYGIAAMLTKNLFSDPLHFYFYLYMLSYRMAISLARASQYKLFPKSIASKNSVYKYAFFFKGTVRGTIDYARFR